MTLESFDKWLANLNVYERRGRRAPNKPLLLLLALAWVRRGESRLQPFTEIEGKLTELLTRFGPQRKRYHPEYPFVRLVDNDKFWETPGTDPLPRTSKDDIMPRALRDANIAGGFPQHLYDALRKNDARLCRAVSFLLENEFPSSYHRDLLEAVGFDDPGALYELSVTGGPERLEADFDAFRVADAANARQRDPKFRERVITAYERRCAVCNYDVRIGDQPLGLEAAHILWHSMGGPDDEENGLALCTLHHTALDRGGISVDNDMRVLVSPKLHEHDAAQLWFRKYEGKTIRRPQDSQHWPNPEYLDWHQREVFKRSPD